MKRIAFKMILKPGFMKEYKKRHDKLWPELIHVLKSSGICNYSIFLDEETNTLFAVQEQLEGKSSQELGELEIVQQWWDYVADLMETNADKSPVTVPLTEVFHLD